MNKKKVGYNKELLYFLFFNSFKFDASGITENPINGDINQIIDWQTIFTRSASSKALSYLSEAPKVLRDAFKC